MIEIIFYGLSVLFFILSFLCVLRVFVVKLF